MMIVKQILDAKGYDVWSVDPDTSIFEALQVMDDKNIGAVLVMDEDDLVGIFSERDYARRVVLQGKSSRETRVRQAMTEPVFGVRPDDSVEGCMGLMTEKRVRHLPVLQGDQVIGVISIGDVVKAIISQKENTIYHLESYITSGHPGAQELSSRGE